jgi:predicted RNase H-like HicB family nuclease
MTHTKNLLVYPVIFTECNDETGHYYGVTSPNIEGMVTDGRTLSEAAARAEDAIATMLADEPTYPSVQDPSKWKLEPNQQVMWVSVNMDKWLSRYGKTVRRNITLPVGLNNWAKANQINVSQVTARALRNLQEG